MNVPPADDLFDDGDHADVVARLQACLTSPSLDDAVRARHREAIRVEAMRAHPGRPAAPAPAPAPAPARARRLALTLAAAGLVVVMGATGAVAASGDALPGQLLYPVKELTEQVVLAAPLPAQMALDRRLAYADRRLWETEALVEQGGDPALVAEALAAHEELMSAAEALGDDDVDLADQVEAAAAVAHGRLTHLLEEGLPEVAASRARAALSAAAERLDRAAPPATRPDPPAPGRQPDGPQQRPERPDPATPGEGRGPRAEPGQPTDRPQPQPPPQQQPPVPDREPGPPAEPGASGNAQPGDG